MPEALPAVTTPSFLNAGFIAASCSRLTWPRTCSSVSKLCGGPRREGSSTGTIWPLNRPSAMARAARCWLCSASSSCMARVMPWRSATFSAVIPMWNLCQGSCRMPFM